jgi:hypothetical protein
MRGLRVDETRRAATLDYAIHCSVGGTGGLYGEPDFLQDYVPHCGLHADVSDPVAHATAIPCPSASTCLATGEYAGPVAMTTVLCSRGRWTTGCTAGP